MFVSAVKRSDPPSLHRGGSMKSLIYYSERLQNMAVHVSLNIRYKKHNTGHCIVSHVTIALCCGNT
jgi:hypothetical protein